MDIFDLMGVQNSELKDKSEVMSLLESKNIHLVEKDCIEWMNSQNEKSIDLVITSPPYNINANYSKHDDNMSEEDFLAWMSNVAKSLKRVLKENGHIFLNVGYTNILPWQAMDIANEFRKHFVLQNQITWVKHIVVQDQGHGQFKPITSSRFITPTTEFIFHFTHKGNTRLDKMSIGHRNKTHSKYPELYTEKRHIATVRRKLARSRGFKDWKTVQSTLSEEEMIIFQADLEQKLKNEPFDPNKKSDLGNAWFIPYEPTSKLAKKVGETGSERSKARGDHIATFPEKLPEQCLKMSGLSEGAIVYDPFVGTGTTGVVAMKHNMVFYGTDIDKKYLDFARTRIVNEIQRIVGDMNMDIFELLSGDNSNDRDQLKSEYALADLIGENGYIDISPFLWEHLNKIYDKHTIRTMLTDCVFEYELEPPYKLYTEEELWKDFSVLQNRNLSDFVSSERWYSPKPLNDIDDEELTFQGEHRYLLRGKNFGMNTSDYFGQAPRFMATNRDRKGITLTWGDRQTLYYAWNSLWGLKVDKVNRDTIRNCIGMRRYKPAQFKPSVARYFYELFGAKRVLDPSAGWGDRLSGFLASSCTEHYVGIDPNSAMHPCYQKQFEFYSQRVDKRVDFIHAPAEDADLSEYKEYFDFIFTSPPYFDAERYTTEETQSFARYPQIEQWLQGFMFPTLKKCWESLAIGGTMIINIVDVYNDHHKATYKICKPMLDFMATMPNCHYQGVIGYQMSVRPNRNQNENAHFAERTPQAEPVWIWTKGENTLNPFRQKEFWEM